MERVDAGHTATRALSGRPAAFGLKLSHNRLGFSRLWLGKGREKHPYMLLSGFPVLRRVCLVSLHNRKNRKDTWLGIFSGWPLLVAHGKTGKNALRFRFLFSEPKNSFALHIFPPDDGLLICEGF